MVAGCGQSRFAAASVASSPAGANANASDEPASGRGSERGSTAQERTVEQGGKSAAGVISTDALGNRVRREDLLELLDGLTPRIAALTAAIEKQVEQHPEAQRLS